MSEDSESLDLSARDLMPNWVTDLEKPPSQRREEKPADRPPKTGPKRKSDFGGKGRQPRFGDDRSGGQGRGGGQGYGRRPDSRGGGGGGRDNRSQRGGGGRDRDFKGRGNRGRDRDQGYDRNRPERQEDSLPNVEVVVQPTPQAVDALAKHIRTTGRAYAMADVAKMVLQSRDRYQLEFREKRAGRDKPGNEGAAAANQDGITFFRCQGDGSLWLSRDEAVAHVLRSPVLKRYYTVEEIETDPPKGNFTVIAVCGMSGRVLGPPNHHEYQSNLARLYRERFSGMSFERYKSRIEMHRDEETLEKWKTQVSRKRVYRVGPAPSEEDSAEPEGQEGSESDSTAGTPETDAGPETETEEVAGLAGEEPGSEEPGSEEPGSEEPGSEETEIDAAEDSSAPETSVDETLEEEIGEAPAGVNEDGPAAGKDVIESEAGGDEAEVAEEGEDEGPVEPSEAEEPEPAAEATETAAETLDSEEELARHFRENHADEAIETVRTAVVAGDIQGRDLSRALFSKLKTEVENLRRGFPLPMIQQLCRKFEKEGLRFFKRGKKALYVSVTRPRPIRNEEAFTDRIRQIVGFVREKPRARVVQLLDALVPDYQPPPGGESFEEHHLTQAEHDVLGDLRWLTMEGYVIEFPNSELLLGGRESIGGGVPESAHQAKTKTGRKRKRAPRKRKRTAKPDDAATESTESAETTVPEKPAESAEEEKPAAPEPAAGEGANEKAGASPESATPAEENSGSNEDAGPAQETSVTS